jgi:hypothetical protein
VPIACFETVSGLPLLHPSDEASQLGSRQSRVRVIMGHGVAVVLATPRTMGGEICPHLGGRPGVSPESSHEITLETPGFTKT